MFRKIALVLTLFILLLSSLVFSSSSKSYLYVSFSADNFVGIELRTYTDSYNNLFLNIGVNYIKGGIRFSSKTTNGLYLSPMVFVDYKGYLNFGLVAGWSTVIQNLNGMEFFIEGGGRNIPQKPEAFVTFGANLKF
ncbi:hypothetical protein [Fervidobacterium sp. 2310opik-2]|uniref:hypothetical protein n=1 Tax=Fervidobacterium sp. 2310opik-2 TaxID=1755815 RepID=UPI0013DFBAA0|nr:hypothetical protein [Fervidobacterium sp. 2310opik-2]KAF2961395.1 hypothetical protein AS161_00955 [Fervidobacterium sp. 2310opik-2]HOJ93847.1 hypothetical protein [Fervidobacterium nodosum]